MSENLEKKFFDDNLFSINEISRYAPSDDRLLFIPKHTNSLDLRFIAQRPKNQDANNLLIAANLLSLLRSTNRVLSKLYALHRHIIENRNVPIEGTQSEIDFQVCKSGLIVEEYCFFLRIFVLSLKVGVDQFIMLMKKYESIGEFLSKVEFEKETVYEGSRKFLVGLNISANYLKHHPHQLESPTISFPLTMPATLIIVDGNNKNSKKDYENLCNFFKNELIPHGNKCALCWIDCDFLVAGFNGFYKHITENR